MFGLLLLFFFFFFFNDTATTEIYTLSLHDALPIWDWGADRGTRAPSARLGRRHPRDHRKRGRPRSGRPRSGPPDIVPAPPGRATGRAGGRGYRLPRLGPDTKARRTPDARPLLRTEERPISLPPALGPGRSSAGQPFSRDWLCCPIPTSWSQDFERLRTAPSRAAPRSIPSRL